jgi:DNA modification methylase
MLGDCRELLQDVGPIHMIFTDPPYGHDNNNNGDLIHRREQALGKIKNFQEARPISGDSSESAQELFGWLCSTAAKLLPKGCCCCCCGGGGGPDPQFARWSLELDKYLDFKQMIVWDKGPMGMGWHYRRSYETILVAQQPGAACAWHDDSNRIENIIRPGYAGIRKIIPQKTDHPTPKPPELAQYFIKLHTKPGQIVFDPFMGGGSTGVAAVREGRQFIGIEIEERWFDIACRKIENAMEEQIREAA